MVTPRDNRFAQLAVERGVLTRAQVETLVAFEKQKQAQGTTLSLWDSAVLKNMMDAGQAETLRKDTGELDVEKLDRFALVRQLGRGGMGSVWLATTPENQKVAVKVLDSSLAAQRSFLTRFFREAQASIKLRHDHIVRGIAVGEATGHYYFAMEFVDGESVAAILGREGALPAQRAAEIILEVAEALAYAHENGTIHRDIKPDNIMLTSGGHAKVADLGLARLMHEEMTQLTATGTSMGTPAYMAPEQCRDAKRADARSDVYSLGATWYHMVAGKPPFSASSALELMQKQVRDPLRWAAELRTRIPRDVMLTIERMMAKSPNTRIQTMQEAARTIRDQCLGQRDILKELGVKEGAIRRPEWIIKVRKGDTVKEYRMPEHRLRELIRRGKVSPEVPARRADTQSVYAPVGRIRALAATPSATRRATAPTRVEPRTPPKARGAKRPASTREGLRDLITHYDEYDRKYRRKRKFRKLAGAGLKLLILAAVIGGLILAYKYLWPHILEYIKSFGASGPAGSR